MLYWPANRDLEVKSIPIDAQHSDGTPGTYDGPFEYDAHSLFGAMETYNTF